MSSMTIYGLNSLDTSRCLLTDYVWWLMVINAVLPNAVLFSQPHQACQEELEKLKGLQAYSRYKPLPLHPAPGLA